MRTLPLDSIASSLFAIKWKLLSPILHPSITPSPFSLSYRTPLLVCRCGGCNAHCTTSCWSDACPFK